MSVFFDERIVFFYVKGWDFFFFRLGFVMMFLGLGNIIKFGRGGFKVRMYENRNGFLEERFRFFSNVGFYFLVFLVD